MGWILFKNNLTVVPMKHLLLVLAMVVSISQVEAAPIKPDVACMALNIYHEARNQGPEGMFAVGLVTMNRVKSEKFPDSVCSVVTQGIYVDGKPALNRCQFSWFCDGKSDEPKNIELYKKIIEIAKVLVKTDIQTDFVGGALFYHAKYVTPQWSKKFTKTASVKDHYFYKD